jgi:L-lactate dehydrogenase complex protein LldG
MSEIDDDAVLAKVRLALGRTGPLTDAPQPPVLPEPLVRLVHTNIGLAEYFARRAQDNKIGVEWSSADELAAKLIEFLRANQCRRLAVAESALLERLKIPDRLAAAGFTIRRWADMTLDEVYEIDCGITDVYAAVAEVGGLVIRSSPAHGKALSLVPPIHVAILQPADFLPDLVDLFEKLRAEGTGSATVIITGPSKTADIEMSLVVGVHGPGVVQAFLLQ